MGKEFVMNDEDLRKIAEFDSRENTSAALFNNLYSWASGSQEANTAEVQKALWLMDEIILNDFKEQFVISIPKDTIFYRARILDKEDDKRVDKGIGYSEERLYGYNWEESKEPPAQKAKAGRTSREGEVALYLASDEITACSEIKPPIRQLVSVAEFKSTEDVQVIDFSKLKYSEPLDINDKKYNANARQFLEKMLALFTIPILIDNPNDYCITQKIVDHFREKNFTGFAYRSFYTNGNNYTFFDDTMKKFRWIDSRVLIHYATASLFVSMDKLEEHKDIRNIANVEQVVERETKDKLMNQIKSRQTLKGTKL